VAEEALTFRVRPWLEAVEETPEFLILTSPNYSVTFRGVPLVRAIRALLAALQGGAERAAATAAAHSATGIPIELVGYAFELLLENACLYSSLEREAREGDEQDIFLASCGQDPSEIRRRLTSGLVVVIATEATYKVAQSLFDTGNIPCRVLPFGPRDHPEQQVERLQSSMSEASFVAVWDFPYRSPFASIVNVASLRSKTPALFGACEGLVGRVGPYVLPHASACLECFIARSLSNAGSGELEATTSYRRRNGTRIGSTAISHPVFRHAVASQFVLEATRILSKTPPQTVGGLLELSYSKGLIERHIVHRVPRCPACGQNVPQRFAWNAGFVAPKLKSHVT
jgi:bacteriocin biosynthesis cyclodehydratase domain-containing protein